MSEYIDTEREAEKEASRTEAAPGSESGAGALRSNLLEGLDKLCLSTLVLLLLKVSLARRRQEKGLRLQL